MAAAAVLPTPHNIQTTLNYYKPVDDQPPFNYTFDPPEGGPRSNIGTDPRPMEIKDARGKEDTFSLDTTVINVINQISMTSWPAYENYSGNLGIQTLTDILYTCGLS